MSISIYDIAQKANVAPSTVSRALQNHPRIGAETRARILALAKEMGYIPSTIAKSLVTNQTWTVGMVAASISDPFTGRVIEGVEQVALEAGYNVLLSTSQSDSQRELAVMEVLQQRRVDGIIVIALHFLNEYRRYFDRIQIPILMINEQEPGGAIHSVAVDDVHGARLAVDHLISLGHRRIGYVSVPDRPKSNRLRWQGYQAALQAAHLPVDPALIFTTDTVADHAQLGRASLKPLLAGGATAVFCYNDAVAIGLLAACHEQGLSLPHDLSVAGFDDIDMAAYTFPPLTTIRQPRFELGRQAMLMMLNRLDGQQPENRVLHGELVVRQTTASK